MASLHIIKESFVVWEEEQDNEVEDNEQEER
jgi:hypothetical protein